MTSQDPDPTQSTPIVPSYTPRDAPPPTAPSAAGAPQSPGSYAPSSAHVSPPAAPEPGWRPPPSDYGRNGGLIFGVILVVIGLWFFATTTLGLELPRLDWGQLWPVLLIGLGAWIVFGAMGSRR